MQELVCIIAAIAAVFLAGFQNLINLIGGNAA